MTEETKNNPDEKQSEDKSEEPVETQFELDFSTFILTLNTSALIHLGDIPDPSTRERQISVPAARHTLQILEILKLKTEGNLDENETKLIDDVLFNLRMKFVQLSGSGS